MLRIIWLPFVSSGPSLRHRSGLFHSHHFKLKLLIREGKIIQNTNQLVFSCPRWWHNALINRHEARLYQNPQHENAVEQLLIKDWAPMR